MTEIKGNLWDFHLDNWVVVTTNGFVKVNREAVMGAGVAKQAAKKFPALPKLLGGMLLELGNHVHSIYTCRIFTYPVKINWWELAEHNLIRRSARELVDAVDAEKLDKVYMPRPGCGNGGLKWRDVKPLIEEVLDDRFVIVEVNP